MSCENLSVFHTPPPPPGVSNKNLRVSNETGDVSNNTQTMMILSPAQENGIKN